jgi:hypothetical protein
MFHPPSLLLDDIIPIAYDPHPLLEKESFIRVVGLTIPGLTTLSIHKMKL